MTVREMFWKAGIDLDAMENDEFHDGLLTVRYNLIEGMPVDIRSDMITMSFLLMMRPDQQARVILQLVDLFTSGEPGSRTIVYEDFLDYKVQLDTTKRGGLTVTIVSPENE